jgi:chemotaxis protein methyltransferase CheR
MKAAAAPAAPYTPPPGPPDPSLLRIRDLIYRTAGIFQPDHKLRLLEERVGRRMKEVGAASLRDYYDCLTVKPTRQAELLNLLNQITIGETYFFRNQPQVDALRRIVLPKVVEAKAKLGQRRLRIWSAGCSTGEEPYTLAITCLEEKAGLLKGWNIEVLANDLNEGSVAHAKRGEYGDYSTRYITPYFRQKYFKAVEDRLSVNEEVRSLVNIQRLNFLDDAHMAMMGNMDVIFCCNVLIYFDLASKQRVIQRFYSNLLQHGYLFLGHSESLFSVNEDFRLVHFPGATGYVKKERKRCGEVK